MGTKIIKSILVLALFLTTSTCFATEIIRVGISDNDFQQVKHSDVRVYATNDYMICDKLTKQVIAKIPASKSIRVIHEEDSFLVNIDNESTLGIQSFVLVSEKGLIGIYGLRRNGKPALYHGAMEFTRAKDKNGFYIINQVEIQDYLKGVVPNEMPVRFGLEALKAQTIAARNYVLAPRVKTYEEFDVFDSVASQVYFGANTEDAIATEAVEKTKGQVATYNGELILALYSSTAGGYTESYSNAFSDKHQFPAEGKPYLVAKPDMLSFIPLNTNENAQQFFSEIPSSYDMESPYFRWKRTWTLEELEQDINKNLNTLVNTGFITPAPQNNIIKDITDIEVIKRGESGKIMELIISTNNAKYLVRKELIIRKLFINNGKILPSANCFFEIKKDDTTGKITEINAIGGGYGHGVGMSQYGAGFIATRLQKNYDEILKHYYTGITISTKPVNIKDESVFQDFYSEEKNGTLVINNLQKAKILPVRINGLLLEIGLNKGFNNDLQEFDISKYLQKGNNEIIYYPTSDNKSVKAYIDLSKQKKEEINNDGENIRN